MQGPIKWFTRILSVKLLATSLAVIVGSCNAAAAINNSALNNPKAPKSKTESTDGIPAGKESYLSRTDILSLSPMTHNLGTQWQTFKSAHFSMIAEILALYPAKTEIYFLARDAEYLYDAARLITEGTSDSNRIHLINVSRSNMRDENIIPYLAENGITKAVLASGQNILLIDTGFSGTIPRVLSGYFSPETRPRLKTHLIVSSNKEYPSSRVFLNHLNPSVNDKLPSQLHGTIVNYEHLERSTDRSDVIRWIKGRYHPLSTLGQGGSDGLLSKTKSRMYREDLKAEWQKPATKDSFNSERKMINETLALLQAGSEEATKELKNTLEANKNTLKGRLIEAVIRDAIEAQENTGLGIKISLADLGLNVVIPKTSSNYSKKNELIQAYPEWAPILEDPSQKIPELFHNGDWQMIGNLIDAHVDYEINAIIAKELFDAPALGAKKDLQIVFIEKSDRDMMKILARRVFVLPHTSQMQDLLKLLIEKADQPALEDLAMDTFSKDHTKDMPDMLKLMIEKGDQRVLQYLVQDVFSKPITRVQKEILKSLIEKADQYTLAILARETFSKPHAKDMQDLLKLTIERGSQNTSTNESNYGPESFDSLARFTFSQPHTAGMQNLLQLLIEKSTHENLEVVARYIFSQPHTEGMQDQLKFLILNADSEILNDLARYTFSQPHTKNMHELLKLLIERADQVTLISLVRQTFWQPHHADKQDLLQLVIEKANQETLQVFASRIFSQAHFFHLSPCLKLIIEKADQTTLRMLAQYTFSEAQYENSHDLLKLLIERADQENLKVIAKFVFEPKVGRDLKQNLLGLLPSVKKWNLLKKSLTIVDSTSRKAWLDSKFPHLASTETPLGVATPIGVTAPLVANDKIPSPDKLKTKPPRSLSPFLKVGDEIRIENQDLTILALAGQGQRGVVFKVQNPQGQFFALKVAKDNDLSTLESFAKESEKASSWKALNIPHAEVLNHGTDFVLKEWVDGTPGDQWPLPSFQSAKGKSCLEALAKKIE